MECAICYTETASVCKLTCGHVFCKDCVKSWYKKSTDPTCPMCRRPMYFRGFHKIQEKWEDDAEAEKCAEIYGESIDEAFEEACSLADEIPRWRKSIMRDLMEELKCIESTLQCLNAWGASSADIEYVIMETDDYYSFRRLKYEWPNEPAKEFLTRYPTRSEVSRGGKRGRALEDEWATVVFLLSVT